MTSAVETKPVEDSVSKVDDELAVGSDLEFQDRWERWEKRIWIVLGAFLLLSFAGVFGRGPLAQASAEAPDHSISVKYERFQRFSTPSVLSVRIDSSDIHNGAFQLWVSEALTKPLGTQRVVPQPLNSEVGRGGILYTFPASTVPASVEFQTQPSALGRTKLMLQIPERSIVSVSVLVYP